MFECKTGWNEDGEELVPAGDAFLKDAKAEDLATGDSNGADDDLFDVSGLLSTRGSAINEPHCQRAKEQRKWSPIHIWQTGGH